MIDQGGEIVAELLVTERAVDVSRMAMSLELYRHHLPSLGQPVNELRQRLNYSKAAVHYDERNSTRTATLPVHLHTVDRCISISR